MCWLVVIHFKCCFHFVSAKTKSLFNECPFSKHDVVKRLPFRVLKLHSRFNECSGYFPVAYKKSFPARLFFSSTVAQISYLQSQQCSPLIFNGLSHLLPRTTAKHFLGIYVPCGNSAPWLTAIVYSMNEDTLHLLCIKEHSWGGLRFLCLLVFQGSRQVTAPCLFHSFISFWLYCISISTHNILEETGHMSRLLFIFPCAVVYITRGSSALWLVAAG